MNGFKWPEDSTEGECGEAEQWNRTIVWAESEIEFLSSSSIKYLHLVTIESQRFGFCVRIIYSKFLLQMEGTTKLMDSVEVERVSRFNQSKSQGEDENCQRNCIKEEVCG